MHKDLEALSKVIHHMQGEIDRLNLALAASRQTTEDIACGAKMECLRCGKLKPCDCDHESR